MPLKSRIQLAALAAVLMAAMPAMAAAPAAAAPARGSGPATPAAATAPAPQAETQDELEEVVIHGRHLKEDIIKAEDEYYALFNQLNKDRKYETHCVDLRLDNDVLRQSRACIPGFVADAMSDWAPFRARCQPPVEGGDEFACMDRNHDNRISRQEAAARPELEAAFEDLDVDRGADGYLSRDEFYATCADCNQQALPSPGAIYMPPTPDQVLANGSKKWYDHMMDVTKSDPRLQKMADHLGELYQQLATAQHKVDQLDAEIKKSGPKHSGGPRKL